MFGEERERPSIIRTPFPQLNMVVGASCCGLFCSLRYREHCSVYGIMKEENYVDILRENVKKSALSPGSGHCWVFQQDNDPKHTSKLVQHFLKRHQNWAAV